MYLQFYIFHEIYDLIYNYDQPECFYTVCIKNSSSLKGYYKFWDYKHINIFTKKYFNRIIIRCTQNRKGDTSIIWKVKECGMSFFLSEQTLRLFEEEVLTQLSWWRELFFVDMFFRYFVFRFLWNTLFNDIIFSSSMILWIILWSLMNLNLSYECIIISLIYYFSMGW